MRAVPNVELERESNTLLEHQIDNLYRCISCNVVRNCLPLTGDRKMCAWCYGATVERDERPTLDYCTRSECGGKNSHCDKHISHQRELISIKNRLSRDTQFPVHR